MIPDQAFFKRMFSDWEQTYTLTIHINPNSGQPHFYDIDEKPFIPSAARVLGHELGHASIFSSGGQLNLRYNQTGAVAIENIIARQLSPNAPMRHPTKGHGSHINSFIEGAVRVVERINGQIEVHTIHGGNPRLNSHIQRTWRPGMTNRQIYKAADDYRR